MTIDIDKERVAGIVILEDKVLLMYRINNGKKYYTFPGGGIEKGESEEDALIREFLEETCVSIKPLRKVYEVDWLESPKQFFYLAEYISGTPALAPDSVEVEAMKDGTQYYEPKWVDALSIGSVLLYPLEVRDLLIEDMKNVFAVEKKDLCLSINTCRQSL